MSLTWGIVPTSGFDVGAGAGGVVCDLGALGASGLCFGSSIPGRTSGSHQPADVA